MRAGGGPYDKFGYLSLVFTHRPGSYPADICYLRPLGEGAPLPQAQSPRSPSPSYRFLRDRGRRRVWGERWPWIFA